MLQNNLKQKKVPKLRFVGFSGEWQIKKLGEISEITSSKRVYSSDYVKTGVPFFRGKEISELKRSKVASDILYIKESKYNEFKSKFGVPNKGDILITSVGTLGNIFKVDLDYDFYFKDGNLIWLKKPNCNTDFLEMVLDHNKKELLKGVIGSTQKALTIDGLKKVQLSFPSLSEQQKIADFLQSVDVLLDNLRAQKQLLETYKKGMMQKIFSQQIRFKDEGGKSFPDWEKCKLSDKSEIIMGQSPESESYNSIGDGVYLIQGNADISDRLTAPRNWTTQITKECKVGDIIMTVRAPVGYTARSIHNACLGRGVCAIRANNTSDTNFLYQLLLLLEKCWVKYEQGTTFTAVNNQDVKGLKVTIPSLPEQQKISDFLTSLDNVIAAKNEQIIKTKKWKKGLMQKMFV